MYVTPVKKIIKDVVASLVDVSISLVDKIVLRKVTLTNFLTFYPMNSVIGTNVRYGLGVLFNTLSYASLLQKYNQFTINYCNLRNKPGSNHSGNSKEHKVSPNFPL